MRCRGCARGRADRLEAAPPEALESAPPPRALEALPPDGVEAPDLPPEPEEGSVPESMTTTDSHNAARAHHSFRMMLRKDRSPRVRSIGVAAHRNVRAEATEQTIGGTVMASGQGAVAQSSSGAQTGQWGEVERMDEYGEPRGYGWVVFAGIMIMMAGVLNFIYGIAAISESHFYTANAHYVISDLNTWGWVLLGLGVLQFCVAFGIWMQAPWARWTGIVIASLNAIVQLIFLPSYPLLSLAIFAIDLLVIYGLAAYGGRPAEA
jgi:hypothetical protein